MAAILEKTMLGKALGATQVIGVDTSQGRIDLARSLELVDEAFLSDATALGKIKAATRSKGCEVSVDCSGAGPARRPTRIRLPPGRAWSA